MTIKRKTQLNLSGSHRNLDADFAQIGTALFVTGSVSGSTGRFTYLSGALSASSTGQPFIVAGSGVTTDFSHTNLNWTIAATGGGGTVQGNDTEIQFNQNSAFAASSSLTHRSGTLGVHAISGSLTPSGTVLGNIGFTDNILKINTSVLVTQSAMFFDGEGGEPLGSGIFLGNSATFTVFSGSNFAGSNDAAGRLFLLQESQVSGEVDVFSNGINIKALTGSVTTGPIGYGGDTNILSSSLLTRAMQYNCVGKFNISVLGAATGSGDFISADIVAVASKSSAGVYGTFGVTEVTLDAIGTNALGWDVNINTNGDIAVSGSGGTVRWYGQVTKMMILSGSADGETIVVY